MAIIKVCPFLTSVELRNGWSNGKLVKVQCLEHECEVYNKTKGKCSLNTEEEGL